MLLVPWALLEPLGLELLELLVLSGLPVPLVLLDQLVLLELELLEPLVPQDLLVLLELLVILAQLDPQVLGVRSAQQVQVVP